jgi:hypothetical protein
MRLPAGNFPKILRWYKGLAASSPRRGDGGVAVEKSFMAVARYRSNQINREPSMRQ